MFSERVTFARSSCLIEIEPLADHVGEPRYVARMSVIEEGGAIVRPLVGQDGVRVKIVAASQRLASKIAVSYLEGRFGCQVPIEPAGSLGNATVGVPFVAH